MEHLLLNEANISQQRQHMALMLVCVFLIVFYTFLPMQTAQPVASVSEASEDKDTVATDSEQSTNEPAVTALADSEGLEATAEPSFTYHRVERGDSLYLIARLYDTTIGYLREINNIETDVIRPGQVLKVPVQYRRDYPVGLRLTDTEVRWIAQMIHAEARGEPYLGQVAVGAVILNRVKSNQFPDTVRDVLYQPGAFQPIRNGSFYLEPNENAWRAAREALNGNDPTNGALFFFNPNKSNDRFMHARPAVTTIGGHRFMY